MSTTTTDGGSDKEQPQSADAQPTAAVTEATTGHNADQIITTDENGTPSMQPASSAEAAPEVTAKADTEEAQAPKDDIAEWAKKKGLEINPENPNEVKLATMQREAERKMHAATQKSVSPPELLQETGNPDYDPIVERQNNLELRQYVRDWFDANPDMKEHRAELSQIATQRPWLTDMDDVKAHFLANPSREAQLKVDGGREALTNLAQKQQQIPPGAHATNSGVYESNQITPGNVYDLIDRHDQAWFEKNHKAISDAMAGKNPQ